MPVPERPREAKFGLADAPAGDREAIDFASLGIEYNGLLCTVEASDVAR